MPSPRSLVRVLVPGLALCLPVLACSAIPVEMHTNMTVQHADGTVEHKETHWHGTLDQLPGQLNKFGDDLGAVTTKLVKELTDVPPPGKITLKDLDPALAKYEGEKRADFVMQAKDNEGNPIDFKYVRIGVASYDDFFKTAQQTYALVYETDQIIHRARELAGVILDTKIDASAELKAQVDKAIAKEGADGELVEKLKTARELGGVLVTLVTALAKNVEKLVSQGQALIASAPSSITNPKVATHIPLIKEGLTDSVKVIKESGGILVDMGKNLGGFGS